MHTATAGKQIVTLYICWHGFRVWERGKGKGEVILKKIRAKYPDELIVKITEEFLSGLQLGEHEDRVRKEILKVRNKNHDALFLEMYFALQVVMAEDQTEEIRRLKYDADLDEQIIEIHNKESRLADQTIAYLDGKPIAVAKKGGAGRASKYKLLETATIELYKLGKWESAPLAAQEITPKIIALSKGGNGELSSATTKPLEWIRSFRKTLKKKDLS